MRRTQISSMFAAAAVALVSVSAFAQTTPAPRDPYTQGASSATGTYDSQTGPARVGDKFDPYSQGADRSTRQDLAPQPQSYAPAPMNPSTPYATSSSERMGTPVYQSDSRWGGPMLGSRLGPRNRFLDGA